MHKTLLHSEHKVWISICPNLRRRQSLRQICWRFKSIYSREQCLSSFCWEEMFIWSVEKVSESSLSVFCTTVNKRDTNSRKKGKWDCNTFFALIISSKQYHWYIKLVVTIHLLIIHCILWNCSARLAAPESSSLLFWQRIKLHIYVSTIAEASRNRNSWLFLIPTIKRKKNYSSAVSVFVMLNSCRRLFWSLLTKHIPSFSQNFELNWFENSFSSQRDFCTSVKSYFLGPAKSFVLYNLRKDHE